MLLAREYSRRLPGFVVVFSCTVAVGVGSFVVVICAVAAVVAMVASVVGVVIVGVSRRFKSKERNKIKYDMKTCETLKRVKLLFD